METEIEDREIRSKKIFFESIDKQETVGDGWKGKGVEKQLRQKLKWSFCNQERDQNLEGAGREEMSRELKKGRIKKPMFQLPVINVINMYCKHGLIKNFKKCLPNDYKI